MMFVEGNPVLFVVVADCPEEMKVEEHFDEVDQQDTELVDVMVELVYSMVVDQDKYLVHLTDYQALLVDLLADRIN
jgi:hypothetical protein